MDEATKTRMREFEQEQEQSSGIIGHCFMCWHLIHPIKWNEETFGIICSVFPDGAPADVMKQLETRGYCKMKNEKYLEFQMREIDKESEKRRQRIAEIEKMKISDEEKERLFEELFKED